MNDLCLGIFAKYWEPGKVKTRLGRSIGDEKAAEASHAFVKASIARFSDLVPRQVVAYSPNDDKTCKEFSDPKYSGWQTTPQLDGDLGRRMQTFFQDELEAGAQSIVLLGTDSPNLPLTRLQQALEALETESVVLGPTEDGGYYLVGISGSVPPIFNDIPWGTPAVWEATVGRLESRGTRYTALEPWYDVDEIDDLHRLLVDLKESRENDPCLSELRRHLLKILDYPWPPE